MEARILIVDDEPVVRTSLQRLLTSMGFDVRTASGGDLYDSFQLHDHWFGLYIADASGHGVSSAMLTVFLKHAMQSAVRTEETGANRGYEPPRTSEE
jgi:sigma-B regulation protein RsbU (phosphoserine phosphatase)